MKHARAVLFAAAVILPAAAYAQSGSDFLMNAAKGDNAEIMMGKLAQSKSANQGVRKFASTLVTDHTKARKQVASLATSMSVSLPSDVKPDAKSEYDKLSQMSGSDFDKEFVSYMTKDHQQDVADFSKEADAKDGKASDLAAKQLPVLKKHLAMAEKLQGKETSSSMQGMQPPKRVQ